MSPPTTTASSTIDEVEAGDGAGERALSLVRVAREADRSAGRHRRLRGARREHDHDVAGDLGEPEHGMVEQRHPRVHRDELVVAPKRVDRPPASTTPLVSRVVWFRLGRPLAVGFRRRVGSSSLRDCT